MAIDVTQLTDYSWSDVAKAAKSSMLAAAIGGSEIRMPDGRFLRRLSLDEAIKLHNHATLMESLDSDSGGGTALVRFGESV